MSSWRISCGRICEADIVASANSVTIVSCRLAEMNTFHLSICAIIAAVNSGRN